MKKIVARITIEVLGSPKDHVEKALNAAIEKIKEEKNIRVANVESYESKEMDNKLWSTFADIEFETEDLKRILNICFDYMPSTLEILEPAGVELDCNDLADTLNDFLTMLHKYNMVINKLQSENTYMMKELEKRK
ncbi:hypothetical protein HZA98_01105 [Candidatus Woesearchaeota archaeon]|nr:hypothetical protein [Candidatus Woesearchaeota archaeon]